MTVYKKSAKSMSLEEMLIARKWLRRCFLTLATTEKDQNELIRIGTRLNCCIDVASSTDCEIAEW